MLTSERHSFILPCMEQQETIQKKRCRVCGEEQALSEYYASPNTRDKHMSTCKTCMRAASHERYMEGARKLKVAERKQAQNAGLAMLQAIQQKQDKQIVLLQQIVCLLQQPE